jgi:hypothetical protein
MKIYSINEWNDQNSSYYYHYTSIRNAKLIIRDKALIAKMPKRDQYGKGVFFTKLKPSFSDYDLICNNYIHYSNKFFTKVECAFAFSKNEIDLMHLNVDRGRDVWCCGNDINLNNYEFKLIARKNKKDFENHLNLNYF